MAPCRKKPNDLMSLCERAPAVGGWVVGGGPGRIRGLALEEQPARQLASADK